jgi:ABC-type transport system involved in cytochrome c biogenesis permease subunit
MAPVVARLATFVALLGSSLLFVWGFYAPRLEAWARSLLFAAFILQTAGLVHQAVLLRSFPVVTPGSFADFFVWMVAGVFLVVMRQKAWIPVGGFVVPVLTLVWLAGQFIAPTVDGRLPRALTGGWLAMHVALATASYTAFVLSAVTALMYLEKERELRRKAPRVFYYRLPALAELDGISYRLVVAGLVLLALAMATGAIWSKAVTGAYWAWTAKEIASVVTAAAYLAYLALRRTGWSGHRSAWVATGAFLLVAANFFGITLVFHGWHDYQG